MELTRIQFRSTYNIQFESLLAEHGASNGRQCTTQTMTDDCDTVIWVRDTSPPKLRDDLLGHAGPIFPETRMGPAARTDLVDSGRIILIIGAEIIL